MDKVILEKIRSYGKSFDGDEISAVLSFISEEVCKDEEKVGDLCRIVELLLPLNPDKDTIVAVLLSEFYFEGGISDEDVFAKFGEGVKEILGALRKLYFVDFVEYDKSAQAEVLRKMFLTMAKDLRVVIIWLAWKVLKVEKLDEVEDKNERLAVARQAMNIYAPVAARLGIYSLRTLLEDLSFKHLDPSDYEYIKEQVDKLGGVHRQAIEKMTLRLKDFLFSKGIEAEVSGRIKSIYGIYRKLRKKNLTLVDDIYDFFAMRVILPVSENGLVDQLYSALGLIHGQWEPVSHRFKDYIAVPKPNGYRSLHTVIKGLGERYFDKPVEIQIRDKVMHREAECGVASHWVYKNESLMNPQLVLDSHAEWIRGLEKIHEFFRIGEGDIKEVEVDVFKDTIFVLTPNGDVKDLPQGACPIDFAYAIHTDVGNRCNMAKVNGAVVSLDYQLKNGDVVEIFTKKLPDPKSRWLSIVKTPLARSKIKAWFTR